MSRCSTCHTTSKIPPILLPGCPYTTVVYACKWLNLVNPVLCWLDDHHPWIEGSCTLSTYSDVPDRSRAFQLRQMWDLLCTGLTVVYLQYLEKIYLTIQRKGGWVDLTVFAVKCSLALAAKRGKGSTYIPKGQKKISSSNYNLQLHTVHIHCCSHIALGKFTLLVHMESLIIQDDTTTLKHFGRTTKKRHLVVFLRLRKLQSNGNIKDTVK